MSTPTVRNIVDDALSPEDRCALTILRHLPVEKFNKIKERMKLGDPGVIGPQTLVAFRRFCEERGFALSSEAVIVFKDARKLGNTGDLRGVIGPQTAAAYFDALMQEEPKLLRKVLAITGAFEGSGFANLTGNFDKQGISFGILQWNFGQKSLPPVLKRMHQRDPAKFREILGAGADRLLAVLSADHAAQMAFALAINDEKNRVIEPWRSRFKALGQHPAFQEVQEEFARKVLERALGLARAYGLKSERAVALMFDIVTQNGSISPATKAKILAARTQKEQSLGRPLTEREMLVLIAEKRAEAAKPQFRADVLSRKMTIAQGTGVVHKRHFDLDREFGLTDLPVV